MGIDVGVEVDKYSRSATWWRASLADGQILGKYVETGWLGGAKPDAASRSMPKRKKSQMNFDLT
jgi:hypothetical protein